MNTLRKLMESEMYREMINVNQSSRYRCYFYEPRLTDNKHDRKADTRAEEQGKINILLLGTMNDCDFYEAYRKFSRRYNNWM